MAFNLIESVKNIFSNELIGRVASALGEGESSVSRAVSGAIPLALGGILSKGTSDMDGAGDILRMAKGASSSGILGDLTSRVTNLGTSGLFSSGIDLARRLLGDKFGNITSAISSFAGIKESSASSILSMVAPAALGILGNHATENNLSAGSLSSFLSTQRSSVTSALPTGLSSIGSTLFDSIKRGVTSSATPETLAKRSSQGTRWIWPLILVAIIGLIYLLARGCNKEVSSVATATDTTVNRPISPVGRESIKVKLPNGVELDAYKGGIEDRLVTYLNSTSLADSVSKNRWFDFDNLNFRTGSAGLTDSSMTQVNNLVAILKAYPKVSFKIGGYTDKTGNEDANMQLSQQRADAVLDALKKAGAAGSQLEGAEGYGSKLAKAAADAPDEERKADRRISVNVRSK